MDGDSGSQPDFRWHMVGAGFTSQSQSCTRVMDTYQRGGWCHSGRDVVGRNRASGGRERGQLDRWRDNRSGTWTADAASL